MKTTKRAPPKKEAENSKKTGTLILRIDPVEKDDFHTNCFNSKPKKTMSEEVEKFIKKFNKKFKKDQNVKQSKTSKN